MRSAPRRRAMASRLRANPRRSTPTAGGGVRFFRFYTPGWAADEHIVGYCPASERRFWTARGRPRSGHVRPQQRRAPLKNQVPVFFIDVLGFKLSDSTQSHGLLALQARITTAWRSSATTGPSLNHVAYEVPNIDGLMRGTGRVKQNGFDHRNGGVGRHGAGQQTCSPYFIEAQRPSSRNTRPSSTSSMTPRTFHKMPNYWQKR